MDTFDALMRRVHANYSASYHYDRIDITSRIWIHELCNLMDEKLNTLMEVVEEENYAKKI